MWIATSEGLFYISLENTYDILHDATFHKITLPLLDMSGNNGCNSFDFDNRGNMWICSNSAVYRYKEEIEEVYMIAEGDHDGSFANLKVDINNNVWFSYNGEGLVRYDVVKDIFTTFNELSVGTQSIRSRHISSIESDYDNNLWIGTKDKGVVFVHCDNLGDDHIAFEHIMREVHNPHGLNSNFINAIFSDFDLLWVGTNGSGVNYYEYAQKEFFGYQTNNKDFVRSLYSQNNKVWIGTHSNGLHLLDRSTNKHVKIALENYSVWSIVECDKERLMVATDAGIFIVNKNSNHIEQHFDNAGEVRYICHSAGEVWWAATTNGLLRLTIHNGQILSTYDKYT